jgi:hypothetical protein
MSFYVTLPSSIAASGSTSEFTTILATPIKLNQRYKVALVELTYNHSWKMELGNLYIFNNNNNFVEQYTKIPIYLEDSYTLAALVDKINTEIKNTILKIIYNKRFEERENSKSNKLLPTNNFDWPIKNLAVIEEIKNSDDYKNSPYLKIEDNKIIVALNSKFISQIALEGRMLNEFGYKESKVLLLKSGEETLTLSKTIDTSRKIKIVGPIYIYAPDLIEYQFLGNTRAPLLRTAVVEPTLNDKIVWLNFDRPHYVNLKVNTISQIKIAIKDEYDDKIAFDYSSLTLKLHFIPQ